MKAALIVLCSLAVILGVVAYFAVFSGTQVIEPVASSDNGSTSTQIFQNPTTTSSTISSSTSGQVITNAPTSTIFQTLFSAPYPATWTEGQPQFAITGATLQGNQLTLILNIQTGSSTECVPVNMRLITDEQGDMAAPSVPGSPNFLLGSDGTCAGSPGTVYPNEPVTFEVDPTQMPFLFTTGGVSNMYFEVATTSDNGLQITVPQNTGQG